jgi:CheY-like chemotaxis protein
MQSVRAASDEAGVRGTPVALLEEQSRHAQKLAGIGRFANVFAHDFNNLLTVIHAYAELALRDKTLSERLRDQLQAIRAASESAAWLSRQLLVHSRRDTGKASVVDLGLLIREVHQLVQRCIPSTIKAELRLQENLPPVVADPGPLHQLLLGAVSHVAMALPLGGRLVIESSAAGPREHDAPEHGAPSGVVVRISGDAGDAPHWPTPAPSTPGDAALAPPPADVHVLDDGGVVLAAMHDVVQALRGELAVTGDAHSGRQVEIRLAGGRELPVQGTATAPEMLPRGTRVLLVEPDEAVRRSVAAMLRVMHCAVIAAGSGDEALRAAALHPQPVQVLLTSPTPTDMTLEALAEAVVRRAPSARTVVMTGRPDATVAVAHHCLDKPFSSDALAAAIAAALRTGTPTPAVRSPISPELRP